MRRVVWAGGLVWAVLAAGWAVAAEGKRLEYVGQLTPLPRVEKGESQSFRFEAIHVAGQPTAVSLVEPRGAIDQPWTLRVGRLPIEGSTSAGHPVLRHRHHGQGYDLPLPTPFYQTDGYQPEASWEQDGLAMTVLGRKKVGDVECWEVQANSRIGRDRTLLIDVKTGWLVRTEQRVFMGQGDEFTLSLERRAVTPLTDPQATAVATVAAAIESLQAAVGPPPKGGHWKPEQLASIRAELPKLVEQSRGTPFESLIDVASRDLQQATRQQEGVEKLTKSLVGRPVEWSSFSLLSGGTLAKEQLAGQVVVLHFWDYNGDSLQEPYGQVGYLDFIAGRRERMGVKVVGVVVAGAGDVPTSPAYLRGLRKLRDFMNLRYPLALDGAKILETVGDPRAAGGSLPLWVVVGADGKVSHAHVGFYDVEPNEGLRELDIAIMEQVRRAKTKE